MRPVGRAGRIGRRASPTASRCPFRVPALVSADACRADRRADGPGRSGSGGRAAAGPAASVSISGTAAPPARRAAPRASRSFVSVPAATAMRRPRRSFSLSARAMSARPNASGTHGPSRFGTRAARAKRAIPPVSRSTSWEEGPVVGSVRVGSIVASARSARSRARDARRPAAVTWAPRRRAICTASPPRSPEPPKTSTRRPACSPATSGRKKSALSASKGTASFVSASSCDYWRCAALTSACAALELTARL